MNKDEKDNNIITVAKIRTMYAAAPAPNKLKKSHGSWNLGAQHYYLKTRVTKEDIKNE